MISIAVSEREHVWPGVAVFLQNALIFFGSVSSGQASVCMQQFQPLHCIIPIANFKFMRQKLLFS